MLGVDSVETRLCACPGRDRKAAQKRLLSKQMRQKGEVACFSPSFFVFLCLFLVFCPSLCRRVSILVFCFPDTFSDQGRGSADCFSRGTCRGWLHTRAHGSLCPFSAPRATHEPNR